MQKDGCRTRKEISYEIKDTNSWNLRRTIRTQSTLLRNSTIDI